MSPRERFAAALNRITRATSVIRTRQGELERREANGGGVAELDRRLERAAEKLERLADELEAGLG